MNTASNTTSIILGFDVAKASITVFDSASQRHTVLDNTPAAVRRFLKPYAGKDAFAVCEATGGYEAVLLKVLVELAIPAHRADALKVKAFIRSLGVLGKTDAIDARALAFYAAERKSRLPLWTPPDQHRQTLQTLVLRRRDLIAMRLAETNRLKAPGAAPIAASIDAIIQSLTQQITAVDNQIAALIQACRALKETVGILQSMPGVGTVSAAGLCALMPELGNLPRRQAAALAGLAPHPRDSGIVRGYRKTRGGRPEVRRLLFMVALTAARWNPTAAAFYKRLIQNGKKPIVAITALMRKIIVILNAKVRDAALPQES